MKMNTLFKTLLTVLTILLGLLHSSGQEKLKETFAKNIPLVMQEQNVPGTAIAIIENGKVILKENYGFGDNTLKTALTESTGFNIGSISKTFTAWGILHLAESGEIKLDSPISDYLKTWKLPESTFNASKVTVRNLLQHTAGLSVHGYGGYESKDELSSIQISLNGTSNSDEKVSLIMEPETEWKYSGGGYSVLQLLIEEVSGESFAEYMNEAVFKPLGMHNTSFTISTAIIKNSAKAYDKEGNEIALRLFNAQAAAGLHTTLEDFILFVKASFNDNAIVSKKSVDLMMQPTELSRGNYGMGYMVMNRFGNVTLTGHGGSNKGWQSGFMLDTKTNSGIIILTNGSGGRNIIFKGIQDWVQWHTQE